jgi:hypothetical protein
MPSKSLANLTKALADVDALIGHHPTVTGGGVGAPKGKKGAELTRGSTVLLAAALEGYVEGVFDEAVDELYASQPDTRRNKFKKERSGKSHGASPWHIEMLFSHLGMPWVLDGVKWQKFSNDSVRSSLEDLSATRNKIAHGSAPKTAQVDKVKSWRNVVERTAKRLDKKVADHVKGSIGTSPW